MAPVAQKYINTMVHHVPIRLGCQWGRSGFMFWAGWPLLGSWRCENDLCEVGGGLLWVSDWPLSFTPQNEKLSFFFNKVYFMQTMHHLTVWAHPHIEYDWSILKQQIYEGRRQFSPNSSSETFLILQIHLSWNSPKSHKTNGCENNEAKIRLPCSNVPWPVQM